MSNKRDRQRRAVAAIRYASEEMRAAWEDEAVARATLEAAEAAWKASMERVIETMDTAKSISKSVHSMIELGL